MGTDRKAARALAQTTLDALGVFEAVLKGVPKLFAGRSPLAIITSRSLSLDPLTRGAMQSTNGITVSIYVRLDPDDEAAAEDQLDDLTTAVLLALHATDVFDVSESSADPASGNLRDVDQNGVLYRVERIPLTTLSQIARKPEA